MKATANPAMAGDINVSQEELKRRHTSQEIRDARFVYGLLMESTTGYSIVEFRMQKANVTARCPVAHGKNYRNTICLRR